jgi:hypothetical protein
VFGEEAIDGGLQFDDGSEHPTLEPSLGQRGEEALDRIEPRGGGGREEQGAFASCAEVRGDLSANNHPSVCLLPINGVLGAYPELVPTSHAGR